MLSDILTRRSLEDFFAQTAPNWFTQYHRDNGCNHQQDSDKASSLHYFNSASEGGVVMNFWNLV